MYGCEKEKALFAGCVRVTKPAIARPHMSNICIHTYITKEIDNEAYANI